MYTPASPNGPLRLSYLMVASRRSRLLAKGHTYNAFSTKKRWQSDVVYMSKRIDCVMWYRAKYTEVNAFSPAAASSKRQNDRRAAVYFFFSKMVPLFVVIP